MPEFVPAIQKSEPARVSTQRSGNAANQINAESSDEAKEFSFDAALAAVAAAGRSLGGGTPADAKALASHRTIAGTARTSGAREEASREVKQAALVDVAQVAAEKLASPSSPGEVAQADAAQVQQPSARTRGNAVRSSFSEARQPSSEPHAASNAATREQNATRAGDVRDIARPSDGGATKQSTSGGAGGHDAAAPHQTASQSVRGATTRAIEQAAVASSSAAKIAAAPHNAPSAGQHNTTAVGGVQGARATAFKKLLEQGQPARRAAEQQHVAHTAAKGLQMLVKEGGGEVVLKLRPGELGAVAARVTIQDARVEATFRAQTQVARDLLIRSVDDLKAALETRGLIVDRIDVRLEAPPEDSAKPRTNDDAGAAVAGGERTREEGVGNAQKDSGSHGGGAQGSTDSRSEDDGRRMARMPMERAAAVADAPMSDGDIDGQPWTLEGSGVRVLDGFEWVA